MNLLTDKIDEQVFIDALKACGIVNSSENPRNNQIVIGKQTVQRFNTDIRDTYIIEKIGENNFVELVLKDTDAKRNGGKNN